MDDEYAFRAEPAQVPAARHWARTTAPPEIGHDAELIVAELVTNAIRHGQDTDRDGAPPTVTAHMTARRGRLRITVTNPPHPHGKQQAADPDEHGRGLIIVAALACASGVRTSRDRTEAWAEITIPGAPYVDEQPQHHPAADDLCPGLGRPHHVETTSGPGGIRTVCATCAPDRAPQEEEPTCVTSFTPTLPPTTPNGSTSSTTTAAPTWPT